MGTSQCIKTLTFISISTSNIQDSKANIRIVHTNNLSGSTGVRTRTPNFISRVSNHLTIQSSLLLASICKFTAQYYFILLLQKTIPVSSFIFCSQIYFAHVHSIQKLQCPAEGNMRTILPRLIRRDGHEVNTPQNTETEEGRGLIKCTNFFLPIKYVV